MSECLDAGGELIQDRDQNEDWSEIEEKMIPKQTCLIYRKRADKSKFEPYEFKKKKDSAVCLECMEDHKGELEEWTHNFCETSVSVKTCKQIQHDRMTTAVFP